MRYDNLEWSGDAAASQRRYRSVTAAMNSRREQFERTQLAQWSAIHG